MSLIRQVWLLVVATIFAACAGSVVVSVWTARSYLEKQLALKNNDNAQSLALTLTQQNGNRSLMELAISAQFDTGFYQSIRWLGADDKVISERKSDSVELNAPRWWVTLVPIPSHPGVAQISSGWKSLGRVEVISQPAFAYADLWTGTLRLTGALLVLGLIAAAIGHLAVHRLSKRLESVVEQARALTERRFITVEEPKTPELQRVTQAMNSMVERVRDMFGEQAQQVEQLRRQASCDPLTGVSHRRHFLTQLDTLLQRDEGIGHGWLVMVRFRRLEEVNRSLGRARIDTLLRRLARSLSLPLQGGVAPDAVGRLNGSDFAAILVIATDGQAELRELFQRVPAVLAGAQGVAIVASAVAWRRGDTSAQLLGSADAALARAEARGDFSIDVQPSPAGVVGAAGEETWRRSLAAAVSEQRTRLEEFPLVDPDGRLIHRECPLRLQFTPDGPFEAATSWLPYAIRTGMTTMIDEEAIDLAMAAIATDAQPRGINMSVASLLDPTVQARLRQRVARVPQAAQRLSIDIDESAAITQAGALMELCRQLRTLGVRIGLEHAGERLATIGKVLESGLDYVKLSRSFVVGVSSDNARATLVRGTTSMLHGLGLRVYAEGVDNPDDLKMLWVCGLDGATGPAVRVGR